MVKDDASRAVAEDGVFGEEREVEKRMVDLEGGKGGDGFLAFFFSSFLRFGVFFCGFFSTKLDIYTSLNRNL